MGEDGKGGRDEYKKSKPIPAPPYGAGLKSHPTSALPPLQGGENLGRSGEWWVKRCEVKLPSLGTRRRGTLINALEKKLREREREREREPP